VREGMGADGLSLGIVSTGGTPNLRHLGAVKGATEQRAGTFIFNDRMMMACGAAGLEECALHVVATVVSRATPERGVLDSGSKTLTADPGGGLDGHGLIREVPQARIHKLAEEHGFLDLAACPEALPVGSVVRVVPNHVCVVVNMVDRLVTTRGGRVVGEIPVAARGLTG
jgi:D-serine deaminase-like pyridoxal phosphate-dependent protein